MMIPMTIKMMTTTLAIITGRTQVGNVASVFF